MFCCWRCPQGSKGMHAAEGGCSITGGESSGLPHISDERVGVWQQDRCRRCVICMMDFVYGDPIRFLPCMHIYHLDCIDDWLMRSFTCPSCMEPVDAALLSSYETN
ncbi:ring finger protein 11 [Limosa lapponica baueri]|uniref:Ring finger protein 11 n=1 Tax=Limosa lapponica baueri TaxID=1758121 RepID=A0A2I0TNP0_LIMLA|nr:ring finger protein 11 [Limosa lapponica baueri]